MYVAQIRVYILEAAIFRVRLEADFVQKSGHVLVAGSAEHIWEVVKRRGRWCPGPFFIFNLVRDKVENVDELLQGVRLCDFHPEHDLRHVHENDVSAQCKRLKANLGDFFVRVWLVLQQLKNVLGCISSESGVLNVVRRAEKLISGLNVRSVAALVHDPELRHRTPRFLPVHGKVKVVHPFVNLRCVSALVLSNFSVVRKNAFDVFVELVGNSRHIVDRVGAGHVHVGHGV